MFDFVQGCQWAAPVKDYLTPAPGVDVIRKPLLVGRHLIILNNRRH